VSPEPEITVHERSPEDEFLILACDGVWDVMTNEDLCDFIRHQLTLYSDVDTICSSIIDTCLHKGSKDNMSVVLVTFPGTPKVSPEAQAKDKELNELLEKKVQEILAKNNNEITLNSLIQTLSNDSIDNLPPGAGIEAKRNVIEEIFLRLNPILEDNNVSNDSN
jgi:protein phosphatase 1B